MTNISPYNNIFCISNKLKAYIGSRKGLLLKVTNRLRIKPDFYARNQFLILRPYLLFSSFKREFRNKERCSSFEGSII